MVEMKDTEELKVISQLIDNMEAIVGKLESSYERGDSEGYEVAKQEILKSQGQIGSMLK